MGETQRNKKVHRNGRNSSDAICINHTILNIAILFVAMIAGIFNLENTPIQANAVETESMIVKSGELDNITWSIDKNGLLTLAPKDGTNGHFKSNPSWIAKDDKLLVKKCTINGKIYADNLDSFFGGFKSLVEITNLENLDTSNANLLLTHSMIMYYTY